MHKYYRKNQKDCWNAFMVRGAKFSKNDIPYCPTTTDKIPSELISFSKAKTMYNKEMKKGNVNFKYNAFIHFYIDDQYFDGKRNSIWLFPEKALEIIKHFSGIILPDFSTNCEFPEPIKRMNIYRMNAFGLWIASNGIDVISNARWGTEETWDYCFDGNPHNSVIAIGTVASRIKQIENRGLFEKGLDRLCEELQPKTIIIYGSANYKSIEKLREKGIRIVQFESERSLAYHKGVRHNE